MDWASYDLVVIRSTWDYSWRADEFTAWAQKVAAVTRLANPAAVVRWNTDKRYLGELAAAGVPTVPTRYFAPGEPAELPDGARVRDQARLRAPAPATPPATPPTPTRRPYAISRGCTPRG